MSPRQTGICVYLRSSAVPHSKYLKIYGQVLITVDDTVCLAKVYNFTGIKSARFINLSESGFVQSLMLEHARFLWFQVISADCRPESRKPTLRTDDIRVTAGNMTADRRMGRILSSVQS